MKRNSGIKRYTGLKRYTPARKISLKQHKRMNKYRLVKQEFLEDKVCAVCGAPATQLHHGKGRIGALLTDTQYLIPVCGSICHDRIEEHVEEAKAKGLSYDRTGNN